MNHRQRYALLMKHQTYLFQIILQHIFLGLNGYKSKILTRQLKSHGNIAIITLYIHWHHQRLVILAQLLIFKLLLSHYEH